MMSEYDALAEYNTEYILPFNGLYNSHSYKKACIIALPFLQGKFVRIHEVLIIRSKKISYYSDAWSTS